MRARHRHFNPKAAGAVSAYDARFISGLSDGDNVSTWASRTGSNDATQSTVGNQPNYETDEINGQPVVNFTPANNDFLSISIAVPSNLTTVRVFRRATANIHSLGFGSSSGTGRPYDSWWFNDNVTYTSPNASGFNTHGSASAATGSFIDSWSKSGTSTSEVRRNGTLVGTSQTPLASAGTFDRLGRAASTSNNGAIGLLMLIDNAVGAPLRKRFEHAAAFSFKISCN